MKRTLDKSVLGMIGLIVSLLIINGVLAYRNTRQLSIDARWVAHTQEVLGQTSGVLRTLVDAETGYRGFVVTGQDEFLEPYHAALGTLPERVSRLKSLTADNARQTERITRLEDRSALVLAKLKEAIELRRIQGFEAAKAFMVSGDEKRSMDSLRHLVGEITSEEERLLEERRAQTESSYRTAVTTGLVVVVSGLFLVGAFIWLLERSLASRRKAAARIHEQQEWFRTALGSIGDAVIATNPRSVVTYINVVAQSLTGWGNDEAIGTELAAIFKIINEKTRLPVENPVDKVLREGQVVGLANHTVLVAKDGTERPIEDSAAPIRDAEGRTLGVILVFHDISERRRAEARTADALRLKQVITDNATTAIIMQDRTGGCTFMNPAAEQMTGFMFEELKGKNVHDHIHHAHPGGRAFPMSECEIGKAVMAMRPIRRHEDIFVRKDGTFFPVLCSANPIQQGGVLTEVVLEFTDISEQKQADDARKLVEQAVRDSEQRLRFVLDSMPQKIFTAKPNGDMDSFNSVWTQYAGVSFEQLRDWGWTQFVHPDDRADNVRTWKHCIVSGEPFQFEQRFRRQDGAYRWHISRAAPMRDAKGQIVMWIGSNTDIHEQKQTAEDLRKLASELSEADHRKDEFLATLAHELRNPLAPLRNGLQIMRLAADNPGSLEAARLMMERQLSQMVRLVDELLDVSRISRGKLELRKERAGLADILHNAVETSRPVIEAGGHELSIKMPSEPIILDADVIRLAQAFANLLNNAAKYSERGSHIWVAAERQGSDAVVSVKDTGVGIPAAMLPKIFDMFTQVDRSLERSQGGLGIGLTLVKRLVEMHGGSVEARSDGQGKGSEFVIRLPVVLSVIHVAKAPPKEAQAAQRSGHCRILVADDNEDSANSLALMLKVMGYDVCTANDGVQALALAETFRPEVILLDIGMPKLNGYKACRRIRDLPGGAQIILIALTGWGQDEDKRRSEEAGFNLHMVKPVEPAALEKLLATLR